MGTQRVGAHRIVHVEGDAFVTGDGCHVGQNFVGSCDATKLAGIHIAHWLGCRVLRGTWVELVGPIRDGDSGRADWASTWGSTLGSDLSNGVVKAPFADVAPRTHQV